MRIRPSAPGTAPGRCGSRLGDSARTDRANGLMLCSRCTPPNVSSDPVPSGVRRAAQRQSIRPGSEDGTAHNEENRLLLPERYVLLTRVAWRALGAARALPLAAAGVLLVALPGLLQDLMPLYKGICKMSIGRCKFICSDGQKNPRPKPGTLCRRLQADW